MCWGKVCYLSHRMTKENLFNRNIFCQKVGIKWELLRWYTWLQHKSSDNAFLAMSNNLAKCTLALPCITQIHRHFIFLLELATWTDGSTKGWCSSFCVSWLGMLVFQSHVGRGENRSLNRSLQAATTHAPLSLSGSEGYLDDMASESRNREPSCQIVVGLWVRFASQTLQVSLWSTNFRMQKL